MHSNRLGLVSMIAGICSMGRTNRFSLHPPQRSSHKRGGGRGRRRAYQWRGDRKSPGYLRAGAVFFRSHPELCRKAA